MKSERRNVSSPLSARIIQYVIGQKHSQLEVARMLGTSESFVSLVKSRERCLTLDHLERLTDSLSVPLGAFLLAVTEPPKGAKNPKALFKSSAKVIKMADVAIEAIMRSGPISSKR